jgi:L-amino acid N-acyltransferase YncA
MRPDARQEAPVRVRDSVAEDMTAIHAIYAHHVLKGLGSFEEVPPDIDEMAARRGRCLAIGLPHLVAEVDGEIAGFAYASGFRDRSAYRHTVENSVYVAPDRRAQGVGQTLLAILIERCTDAGFFQMVAVIGDSENDASIRLHEQAGFRRAGVLRSVGHKFGRWVDSVLMQRQLNDDPRD